MWKRAAAGSRVWTDYRQGDRRGYGSGSRSRARPVDFTLIRPNLMPHVRLHSRTEVKTFLPALSDVTLDTAAARVTSCSSALGQVGTRFRLAVL